jgi:succinoglycan biosynthesis protein ExoL
MKFTFLLSSTSHVRFLKRVEIISKLSSEVDVYAFHRKNSFPGKQVKFELKSLGIIEHKSYLKRSLLIIKSINKIRQAVKRTDVIYTFGLDMLVFGWVSQILSLNKTARLVYEVGDIREILIGEGRINKIVRALEKYLLKRVSVVVVTSNAFATEYFSKIQKSNKPKYHVIENKLDLHFMQTSHSFEKEQTENDVLTIGYFGVLRCDKTWEILKQLAQKGKGKIKISIRGIPGLKQKHHINDIENIDGIKYGGSYVVPDDLPGMYGNVDIVWASYPYQGSKIGNWSWAKTIRFYESCYYKVPVFVQKGTEDCKTVNKYGIGICLDLEKINETVDYILNLSEMDVLELGKNIKELPESVYLYSDEHEKLIKILE